MLAATAFGGLLGATAFSRTSDATTTQPSDDDTASSGVTRDTTDGEPDDPYGGLDDLDSADPYGGVQGDRFGSSVQRPEPPAWGGSAQPGGESTVPGDDGSSAGGSTEPDVRSQGS